MSKDVIGIRPGTRIVSSGRSEDELLEALSEMGYPSPEILLSRFDEYKDWVDTRTDSKFKKVQYVGKDGDRMVDDIATPYSLSGFITYCRRQGYPSPRPILDGKYNEAPGFADAVLDIRTEVEADNITGAMVGAYNANLAARIHGLADSSRMEVNQEIHTTSNTTINLAALSLDDLRALRQIGRKTKGGADPAPQPQALPSPAPELEAAGQTGIKALEFSMDDLELATGERYEPEGTTLPPVALEQRGDKEEAGDE